MSNGIKICRRGCCPEVKYEDETFLIYDDNDNVISIPEKQKKEFSKLISLTMGA